MARAKEQRELYDKKPKQKTKARYFFSLRKLEMADSIHVPYQIEIVGVEDGKIIFQALWDKPDTKEMVRAKLEELMDPNNEMETDYATNSIAV